MCEHQKYEICDTISCPKCYYEELMRSKDRSKLGPMQTPYLPHHQLLAWKKEQRSKNDR